MMTYVTCDILLLIQKSCSNFKDISPYASEIVAKQVTISYLRSRNYPFHDYFEK